MNSQTSNGVRIAYLHGRPGPHPTHRKFAESVGGEFIYVDFKMRWQDKRKSILYRFISGLVCAFTFPNKKSYNVFLVDNLHFYPVIMKILHLITRKQKIVAHMGSHTLYFIYAHRFSKFIEWMHLQALKRYDALICEGKMSEDLVKKILKENTPKLYTVINGIPTEHFPSEQAMTKGLSGKNILFIGHGPGEDRIWYKGLDIMLRAFELSYEKDQELTLTIVGDWDKKLILNLLGTFSPNAWNAITFAGSATNLGKYTRSAALYLHCARGEAYGIAVLIALASGVPAIVSEWTGAKEVVEKADNRLVVSLSPADVSHKINWYFKLSSSEKIELSLRCTNTAKKYTEEKSIEFHKNMFLQMESDFRMI